MSYLVAMNGELIRIILLAMGLGLFAGLIFFVVLWGARLALGIVRGS